MAAQQSDVCLFQSVILSVCVPAPSLPVHQGYLQYDKAAVYTAAPSSNGAYPTGTDRGGQGHSTQPNSTPVWDSSLVYVCLEMTLPTAPTAPTHLRLSPIRWNERAPS